MSESDGSAAAVVLGRVVAAVRAQSCAAAARLVAIGELFAVRMAQCGETEDWAVDAEDAVCAEVAAALSISHAMAASHLRYARALREQLPRVGAALVAGEVDEAAFRVAVFRTGLITDRDVLARVDARLAVCLPRWGSVNRPQLANRIDAVVAREDLDAVRRRADRLAGRQLVTGDVDNGLSEITATVYAPDAYAFAERATALAATVCDGDPRTLAQRRADAVGAMAAGADRLGCRCGDPGCLAGGRSASAVTIHVITDQNTVQRDRAGVGAVVGMDGLLPGEMVAELAASARVRSLTPPGDAAAEAGYVPSRGLAAFVRARDMTCRFPGCSVPATRCDVDHVIPWAVGGPTQAANLSCKCRTHHLLKTFWGWRDEQLADATLIWTSPDGQRYVTHPGSAILFPGLCAPTGAPARRAPGIRRCGDRSVMMPRRQRTRTAQRASDVTAERRRNHQARTNPPPPVVYDEDLDYQDTFAPPPQPPPPF